MEAVASFPELNHTAREAAARQGMTACPSRTISSASSSRPTTNRTICGGRCSPRLSSVYRPLEVIVSDDCSPRPLEAVVREFAGVENRPVYRSDSSARPAISASWTISGSPSGKPREKYLVPFAHDNRFIDRGFIADAVPGDGHHARLPPLPGELRV